MALQVEWSFECLHLAALSSHVFWPKLQKVPLGVELNDHVVDLRTKHLQCFFELAEAELLGLRRLLLFGVIEEVEPVEEFFFGAAEVVFKRQFRVRLADS